MTPTQLDPDLLAYHHVHWEEAGLHLVRLLSDEPLVTVTDYRDDCNNATWWTTIVLPVRTHR